MKPLSIGVVADDFTGATDIASLLVRGGFRVIQSIGVPDADADFGEVDAVVIALKSRTAPVDEAIAESLAAVDWMMTRSVSQVFFKYCSTFDSTDRGNIGPVADAIMEKLGADIAIVCPAFPENGRTIYKGHLFVGDMLLENSPMKDHPLTPMRHSNLVTLMDRQSAHRTGLVALETVDRGSDAIAARLDDLKAENFRYAVVDACRDADLHQIGKALDGTRFVTGGSGIALGLPANFGAVPADCDRKEVSLGQGRDLIVSGSCSMRTREQVARFSTRHPAWRLDPQKLAAGETGAAEALSWIADQDPSEPVLVYSTAEPEEVRIVQDALGVAQAGQVVENTLAAIASGAADLGVRRVIAAGGETSGAIVQALGVAYLEIGAEIAPGVPWTRPGPDKNYLLTLKSGNFGGPDFFNDALNTPF